MNITIIGSGISGVTCAELLATAHVDTPYNVTLLSASPVIKAIANFQKLSRTLESFDIVERTFDSVHYPNLHIVQAQVDKIDTKTKVVVDSTGRQFHYDKLCICSGARPNLLQEKNEFVLGIRDTESVKDLQNRLGTAKRIMVVGNGGIAMELIHEVDFCEIIWSIKDSHIGTNFLDAGASTFFVSDHVFNTRSKENLSENNDTTHSVEKANDISDAQVFTPHSLEKEKMARKKAAVESNNQPSVEIDESLLSNNTADNKYSGAALGPRWQTQVVLHKEGENTMKASAPKTVEFETTATRIFLKHEYEVFYNSRLQENPKTEKTSKVYLPLPSSQGGETWPIYVQLSNDKIYGCDFVVSATGVIPNSSIVGPEFLLDSDRGIVVDENMRTNVPDVYAAGDVCHVNWETSPNWFQMKLWTQARQMGAYVARCIDSNIRNEEAFLDFCFELFAHVTRFFGFKVVLLGRYNAQGMEAGSYEILLRVTKGHEYIKIVVQDNRVQGALLIGETDLEETFENLILNQLDISSFKDTLLDPDVDIEDYFD